MNIFDDAYDNIFGGHDYVENGHFYGHSEPNDQGGFNYFDENNHMVAHTEDNHIGGTVIYDDNGLLGNFYAYPPKNDKISSLSPTTHLVKIHAPYDEMAGQ